MNIPTPLTPFREEIVASVVVLLLVTIGSFYAVSKIFPSKDQQIAETTELKQLIADADKPIDTSGTVLGQNETSTSPVVPSPTIDPFESEVTFGKGGMYDYGEYTLQIDNPRLGFNLKEPGKRKFVVDFSLTNKTLNGGLPNQVFASIIKDGNIIVPKTALSVTQNVILKPGETQKFSGSMALIEGTDVKEVLFEPLGDIPKIIHPLKQD